MEMCKDVINRHKKKNVINFKLQEAPAFLSVM